jgi:aryl-alcohol dehydrogenase-like predicted oxidoreductase
VKWQKSVGLVKPVISLAWIKRNPVVAAPIVGALKTSHIDDAVQALSITLTDEEAAAWKLSIDLVLIRW